MKRIFVGPTHRVQLEIHAGSGDPGEKHFRVDALPRGAHRSVAYIHGEQLYRGTSAHDAWEAVLRLAPAAQAPECLRDEIAAGMPAVPPCPFCGTAIRPHHRQTQVPWPAGDLHTSLRTAHAACAEDQIHLDPRLLPSSSRLHCH